MKNPQALQCSKRSTPSSPEVQVEGDVVAEAAGDAASGRWQPWRHVRTRGPTGAGPAGVIARPVSARLDALVVQRPARFVDTAHVTGHEPVRLGTGDVGDVVVEEEHAFGPDREAGATTSKISRSGLTSPSSKERKHDAKASVSGVAS